ncbi:MAG: peptidyl-prolyl cis-trans isomerase, partial [Verrucomicrobiales bacterium]|nr:peptidyl-prolyl cis-trans isomerase [Verrucomicrobiales bacterium]
FGEEDKQIIDMGFLKQGQTMPEVESVTFSMQVGEVSPIVATHFGFHLFRLEERKEPTPVPFDELKDQLVEQFLNHSREQKIQELIDSLKEKATIEEVEEPVEA